MNKFLTKLEGKYAARPSKVKIYDWGDASKFRDVIDEANDKLRDLGIANLSPEDKATIRFYYEDQINYIIKDGKHG